MWLRTFFLVCESDLVALPVTAIRGPTCSLPYRYVVSPAVFLTVAWPHQGERHTNGNGPKEEGGRVPLVPTRHPSSFGPLPFVCPLCSFCFPLHFFEMLAKC